MDTTPNRKEESFTFISSWSLDFLCLSACTLPVKSCIHLCLLYLSCHFSMSMLLQSSFYLKRNHNIHTISYSYECVSHALWCQQLSPRIPLTWKDQLCDRLNWFCVVPEPTYGTDSLAAAISQAASVSWPELSLVRTTYVLDMASPCKKKKKWCGTFKRGRYFQLMR